MQTFRNVLAMLAALALTAVVIVAYKIILTLILAILLGSALRPIIVRLQRIGLSQSLALGIVYGALALLAIVLLVAIVPPMINRFASFLDNDALLANRIIAGKNYVESVLTQITGSPVALAVETEQIREAVSAFVADLQQTAPGMLATSVDYLGAILLVIVMGAYWITSRDGAVAFLTSLFPITSRGRIEMVVEEIELRLGAYLRGVLMISLTVGTLSFIPLVLLGIPNAPVISFLYGALTTIPIVGGLMGVVAATAVALLTSPTAAITVLIVTVALQQVEEYFVTPRVMSQSVDFNPILIIVFVSMGFALRGLVGGLLGVPIAGTIAILLKHLVLEPRQERVVAESNESAILITTAK